MIVGAVSTAVVAACGHAQNAPQAQTPPATTTTTQAPLWSQLIRVTFPPGSKVGTSDDPAPPPPPGVIVPTLKPGEKIEVWTVPREIPDEVVDLRRQLPIYAAYDDLPWCVEDVLSTRDGSVQWAWGDDKQVLQVAVIAPLGKTNQRGSEVHITHFPDISCSKYLKE